MAHAQEKNDLDSPASFRTCPMVVTDMAKRTVPEPARQILNNRCNLTYNPQDTTVYQVPVVVHIIHNGEPVGTGANIDDARVFEQIRILNEDFRRKPNTPGFNTSPVGADARIEFALAVKDTLGNAFNGIVRKNGGRSNWSIGDNGYRSLSFFRSDKYFNIWVINLNTFLGAGTWPVSSLPGMAGLGNYADSARDGLVVGFRYFGQTGTLGGRYNQGRTATHEIGHCLGLIHVWGDGDCTATDHCNDTPAQNGQVFFCPNPAPNTCPNQRPGPDQIENFMQYTDDVCMNLFTRDQVTRMRTVLQLSPLRCTLPKSDALPTFIDQKRPTLRGQLYPNPGTSAAQVVLSLNTLAEHAKLTWVNAQGQTMEAETVSAERESTGILKLMVKTPSVRGMYNLQVQDALGNRGSFKLVVD